MKTLTALGLLAALGALPQAPRRPAQPAPFKTTMTAAQMTGKQAVVETAVGTVIIDLGIAEALDDLDDIRFCDQVKNPYTFSLPFATGASSP
jgi:hypothetical protein